MNDPATMEPVGSDELELQDLAASKHAAATAAGEATLQARLSVASRPSRASRTHNFVVEAAFSAPREKKKNEPGCCRRCCDDWHRCCCEPGGCMCRCLSPSLWNQALTGWLDRWARRSIVTAYTFYELVTCGLCVFMMIMHSEVANLGFLINQTVIFFAIIIFRTMTAMLGVYASCQRKVARMRLYLVLFYMTNPCFLFIIVPFFRAHCECRSFGCSAAQWNLLHSFVTTADTSTPETSSDEGSADSAFLSFSQFLRTPEADLAFSDDRRLGLSPLTLGDNIFDDWYFAEAGVSFENDASEAGDELPTEIRCSKTKPVTGKVAAVTAALREIQCRKKDEDLVVTEETLMSPLKLCTSEESCLALEVRVTPSTVHVCGLSSGAESSKQRQLLPKLDEKALEASKKCGRTASSCSSSLSALRSLGNDPPESNENGDGAATGTSEDGEDDEGNHQEDVGDPSSQEGTREGERGGKQQTGGTSPSQVPSSGGNADAEEEEDEGGSGSSTSEGQTAEAEGRSEAADCKTFTTFLVKRRISRDRYPINDDQAEMLCRLVTHGIGTCILILLLVSIPISIVLVKYVQNHCGDYVGEEDIAGGEQWTVEEVEPNATRADSSDDDFQTGSYVSLSGRNSQREEGPPPAPAPEPAQEV